MRNYAQHIEFVNKWIDKYLAKSVDDVNGSIYTQNYSPDHGPGCHNPPMEEDAPLCFQALEESGGWGVQKGPV